MAKCRSVISYLKILASGAKIVPLTISREPIGLSPLDLISDGGLQVLGTGTAPVVSLQAMLRFAAKHGVAPQIETFPLTLDGVNEAMQKLRDGKMRYRGVLVTQ